MSRSWPPARLCAAWSIKTKFHHTAASASAMVAILSVHDSTDNFPMTVKGFYIIEYADPGRYIPTIFLRFPLWGSQESPFRQVLESVGSLWNPLNSSWTLVCRMQNGLMREGFHQTQPDAVPKLPSPDCAQEGFPKPYSPP